VEKGKVPTLGDAIQIPNKKNVSVKKNEKKLSQKYDHTLMLLASQTLQQLKQKCKVLNHSHYSIVIAQKSLCDRF
jgi:hypothetical protein